MVEVSVVKQKLQDYIVNQIDVLYDMQKAHEVCNKFKDKLEEDIEVADVYVAINAQYHDYCKLFEKWFGKGNFDDMIFESAIDFWFDDVDFGEDKLWKYFNELK